MSQETVSQQAAATRAEREPAWPPALTPYVNADGTIGHAELGIGDAVLMLAEASDLWPGVPVRAPDSPATFSHTLNLEVDDVDGTTERARLRRRPGRGVPPLAAAD